MNRVFKYRVLLDDYFEAEMPKGARILSVAEQYPDEIYMWALVDDKNPVVRRVFRVAGTGHQIKEDNLKFIGTFMLRNGALVFHLFEV